jgi:DNA (cytosine-5)-methyltransferase 1
VRPRALDLFCGAGGVSVGLQRAGFDVVGVDINPQPNHRGGTFVQADALEYPLEGFDFIWASPPCQGYSIMRNLPWLKGRTWPMLIEPVRERLKASGALWTIENVPGAPLDGPFLCGRMFGLKVYRHRLFESNFFYLVPPHPKHIYAIGRSRKLNDRAVVGEGGMVSLVQKTNPEAGRAAMGIPWMNRNELGQAIPPAYAEFIGHQAVRVCGGA